MDNREPVASFQVRKEVGSKGFTLVDSKTFLFLGGMLDTCLDIDSLVMEESCKEGTLGFMGRDVSFIYVS